MREKYSPTHVKSDIGDVKGTSAIERQSNVHSYKRGMFDSVFISSLRKVVLFVVSLCSSSETQGQLVGSGERARQKFWSKGKKAPGYRLSPDYFQNFKRLPAPDWAKKKCFVLLCPIGKQFLLVSFREFVHDFYFLPVLTRKAQKQRNYRWVEKTFGMLSTEAIQYAPRIFFLWLITMYRK